MLPAPRSPSQARARRLPHPRLTASLLILSLALPGGEALAQDVGDELNPTGSPSNLDRPRAVAPASPDTANANKGTPAKGTAADAGTVAFEADTVQYDQDSDTVTATGNVVLRRQDQSARSDRITWNQTTGKIIATGNVRLVDENGNQLFTDSAELTEELKAGAMQNLLLAMRQGGRLAAASGTRGENGAVTLNHAAYTACAIEDNYGCPKTPTWRVTASRVEYDPDTSRITFHKARLDLFGVIAIPLVGFKISTNGQPHSGVLSPNFRSSPSNGFEINGSYYWHIADNRDLTATAYVYTKVAPMVSAQYRAVVDGGAYQITGYATASRRISPATILPSGSMPLSQYDFRGYIFANGQLQLSPNWSVTASIRRATDRTFLRRYDLSSEDRLRSLIEVDRVDDNSYLAIQGWATQTLRINDGTGQEPVALPLIDYRKRLTDPWLGGRIELQANSLNLMRNQGQDTQRAFAKAQWDLRRYTPWGQVVTLTALVRGDVYHSSGNDLTDTISYRGNPGWQGRGIALGAVDVTWPLVGAIFGASQLVTPHIQVVAAPPIRNLAIPNEDSRAIDLEETNLFALDRFPGYDRIEDGVRFTYGLDYQVEWPNWRIKSTVGQSYRLSRQPGLALEGTGLSGRSSDIVGRTEIRYRDFIQITHRYRLDKDSLALRRNEIDATIGGHQTYAEIGYTQLNRDIDLPDLRDRSELRAAGRIAFLKYWSVFGSAVVNLTKRSDDPLFGSDGFQPLRTRLGLAYTDDCIDVGVTWRRDYTTIADARQGDTFMLRFALKNIGFH